MERIINFIYFSHFLVLQAIKAKTNFLSHDSFQIESPYRFLAISVAIE